MLKQKIYRITAVLISLCIVFSGCEKEEKPQETKQTADITFQMKMTESFNPLVAESQSVRDALSLCYEPLFALDEKMMPYGVLADSITVSEDCMSAIVTLKESVLWHDGISFTSADVVHTINTIKNNSASPYYKCVEYIETAQSLEPLSFKMNFSKPYGQIIYSLYFPVIASHNKKPDEKIIGTGPYSVDSYAAAVSLNLKKNIGWHGDLPTCENLVISIVRDNEVATSAFNSGNVSAITSGSYDLQNDMPKNDPKMTQYPSKQYEFIAFNHKKGIFSSDAVRIAVSSAIDRSAIVADAYQTFAQEANVPIHPSMEKMAATSVGSQYNLSNAEEMLFFEGYSMNESTGVLQNDEGKKLSFSLLVNKENIYRVKAAEMLCSQLFLAGIEVKVKELDFKTYSSEISKGNYDAYLGGTILSNLYDFGFLLSENGSLNNFGYKSEYMNAALEALSKAPTEDDLATALISFDDVFLSEQPVCGIAFTKDVLMTAKNISGKLSPLPGYPYGNINKWKVSK